MKTPSFLIAAAAAATLAVPAHAQLLGGGAGGLTGGLGQTVSGTLGGSLGASANKSIDRRSGRAAAGASADGMVGGTLDSATAVTGPRGSGVSASKSVRAEKRVSKSASAQVDGPGTDDGRNLVGGVAGTAGGVVGRAAGTGQGIAGSVSGAATGAAGGSASGGNAASSDGMFAGSGSLTGSASGDGALDVGTLVRDAKGRAVGRIEAIREETRTVLVSVGDRTAELPAGSLSANGEFATAALSKAEIKKMATADEPSAQP